MIEMCAKKWKIKQETQNIKNNLLKVDKHF